MLRLKRIVYPFDFMLDSTGDVLMYGDFFYEDDEDIDEHGQPYRIRATTYQKLKTQNRRDNWDYSRLNYFKDQREYAKELRQAEYELAKGRWIEHKVWGKNSRNNDIEAGTYQ